MTIMVTGGAGFIGANFVFAWVGRTSEKIVNLDALTYAGNAATLQSLLDNPQHVFVRGDICDQEGLAELLRQHRPRAILHFAAESHVDRSIGGPAAFLRANVQGTFALLDAACKYWRDSSPAERDVFRFHHVSTDEVYGSLSATDPPFAETSAYAPNSPYAASKAAADHLVRAWHRTYGLPVVTTNCSNNYGPYQFPEKLIPLVICNALEGQPLPVYGDGGNVRDWLYVTDHCEAILLALAQGRVGESYNIGGNAERTNIQVVRMLCELLDELRPDPAGSYARLIKFVTDRPGHDRRYAIDGRKIAAELGWRPRESFASGLRKTVQWYLASRAWVDGVKDGSYRDWMTRNYQHRLTELARDDQGA